MLQIIGEDQVTLKVTVAEVSRNVMKQLGVNMIGEGTSNGISWGAFSENVMGLGKPFLTSDSSASAPRCSTLISTRWSRPAS